MFSNDVKAGAIMKTCALTLFIFLIPFSITFADVFQLTFERDGEIYYASSKEILVYRDNGTGRSEFIGKFFTDGYGRVNLGLEPGRYVISFLYDEKQNLWLGAGVEINGTRKLKTVELR
jgi:hypothetical protein